MRRSILHIIVLSGIVLQAVVTFGQAESEHLTPLHLQAFPFGTEHIDAPKDLMVDDHGYPWLLDQYATFCVLSDGPLRVHDLNTNATIERWLGASEDELVVGTSSGPYQLPMGEWQADPKKFLFTDASSLRTVDLPDGRSVHLTDTGSLVIRSQDSNRVLPLIIEQHSNLFKLIPGEFGRMLFDPRNGIWILGQNGLMLASHLELPFQTFDTPAPIGKVTQVTEDESIDRRLILSQTKGVIIQELSTGRYIEHFATDATGDRLGGTKWRVVNGRHFFDGRQRIYEYDPATDRITIFMDLEPVLREKGAYARINDLAWNRSSKYLYAGSADNLLVVIDPVSGKRAVHDVKPDGTFSGINLILETEPFGQDRALVIAEHGQFLIDGLHGPIRPAQQEWPGMQFGPNFRASGVKILGDSLVLISSFADGLFIYHIGKDSLYKPEGLEMDQLLISDLFVDGLHHVYGATRDGLMMCNVKDNTVRMLSGKHGFPLDNLFYRYMSNGKPGEMFLGLTDRYARFETSDLLRDNTDDLIIEDLEVNGKRVKTPPYRILGSTMHLSYLENSIGLRIGTPVKSTKPFTSMFIMLNGRIDQIEYHEGQDLIRFHAMAPGTHRIQMAFSRYGPFTDLMTVVISPPIWRSWWFIALIAATLFGVALFIFRLRSRHVQHEAIMKAEYDSRIAQLELSSLRAQMHPHFIFNSLNSIKSFIADNEPRNATRYLNKFSQLIRAILNNSRHERIDLRSELKALELYLELEQMRFDKSFEFVINVADGLDQDELTIPPMVLQPYAENAIWHGLMHKEGARKLEVEIARDERMLLATIRDNGIGRVAAEELKSKTATKHKSLGMKITSEIIQRTHEDGATGIRINDLQDPSGQPCGTEVCISIPITPTT